MNGDVGSGYSTTYLTFTQALQMFNTTCYWKIIWTKIITVQFFFFYMYRELLNIQHKPQVNFSDSGSCSSKYVHGMSLFYRNRAPSSMILVN